MPSSLELKGGLVPNLTELSRAEPLLTAQGATLVQRGERVMSLSVREAPVLDGTLRSSRQVTPPEYSANQVEVVIGYGGAANKYALKAHENPRTGKTGGVSPSGKKYRRWSTVGKWHFLIDPFLAEQSGTLDALRETTMADIQRRLRG